MRWSWLGIVLGITLGVDVPLRGQATWVYWGDKGSDQLWRALPDGTNPEPLVSSLGAPSDIEVDLAAGKVYWADAGLGLIQRADLDGTGIETVHIGPAPVGLALDLAVGKIVWVDRVAAVVRDRLDLG